MEPVQKKLSTKYLLLLDQNVPASLETDDYDDIHIWPNIIVGLRVNNNKKFYFALGNCDIHVKQKILVINKTKQDKILLKLKV
jgi:hypothetical protein